MGRTQLSTREIGSVQRNDFDTATTGQAVITKAIAGTNISLSSTGVDAGTGDVTINVATSKVTINTQTASYTLVLGDFTSTDVQMNVASANNLTVPPNSSVAADVGSQVVISQIGAGQTTVVAGSGVTINYPSGLSLRLRTQNSQAVLEKTGTNIYYLSGDLESTQYMMVSLSSNATANSTTNMVKISGLDKTVDVGSYKFEYVIIAQSSATATSLKFAVNHTGTTTKFIYNLFFPSQGVTAATGVVDQEVNATTGQVWSYQGTRVKNTTLGPNTDVDTINADIMYIIKGVMVVTVSGTMELYHGSETAASTQVMADTSLEIIKTR